MQSRRPLNDAGRSPRLAVVGQAITARRERGICGVVTYSALKRDYRRGIFGHGSGVRSVYCDAPGEMISESLAADADILRRRPCSTGRPPASSGGQIAAVLRPMAKPLA
jgi:gluconate kinase